MTIRPSAGGVGVATQNPGSPVAARCLAIWWQPCAQRHIDGVLGPQDLLRDVSEGLFIGASLFGLWLLVSLLLCRR